MKAMLLAAGFGTRLRPLTNHLPKPLIPVNRVPLIFYNLALLKRHGIREVVINLHHFGHQIKEALGSGRRFGLKFQYSFEKEIRGTGGGIKKAARFFKRETFLVLNADIIVDIDIRRLTAFHQRKRVPATIVVKRKSRSDKFGTVFVKRDGEVASFFENPHSPNRVSSTFFTGIHVIHPPLLKRLIPRGKSCIIRDGYKPFLLRQGRLGAFEHSGFWSDLGTIERLKKTEAGLRSGRICLSYRRELEEFKKLL
jgi:NDP-sugar pyrophosphorylase family protein